MSHPKLPVVCRKLRTKQAFGSFTEDTIDWRGGESTTDVFWCLKTMETWGTDDQVAHPYQCISGRICFEAPAGEDENIA